MIGNRIEQERAYYYVGEPHRQEQLLDANELCHI